MDGTIIGQGRFVATPIGVSGLGAVRTNASVYIAQIPCGVDWMWVFNYTQAGTVGTATANFNGVANSSIGWRYYWQRGMAAGTGIVDFKSAGTSVDNTDTLVSGGFTLFDPSGQTNGAYPLVSPAVATTASTNATRPVVSTASTAGLVVGSVVRMSNTAQTDVNGIDMVVGAVTLNTSFTLLTATNALATAPGAIGGAGFYRIVNVDPLYYPRNRYVVNITQATNANVSTSVAHGLTVGQEVRFNIPAVSGMVQLNPDNVANNFIAATIVSVVDDYNFTINVDTTGFTAFTWPTIAQQPSSFPQVIPVGEDTGFALTSVSAQVPVIGGVQIFNTNTGILADSTVNTGYLGMLLGSGGPGVLTTNISGPSGSGASSNAGVTSLPDTIYWRAGKSTFGGL